MAAVVWSLIGKYVRRNHSAYPMVVYSAAGICKEIDGNQSRHVDVFDACVVAWPGKRGEAFVVHVWCRFDLCLPRVSLARFVLLV